MFPTNKIISLLLILLGMFVQANAQSSKVDFRSIWLAKQGSWATSFTRQEHTRVTDYKMVSENDVYQAGIFPDKFREDQGSPDDGNADLQVDKASYTFKKFKLRYKGFVSFNIEKLIFGKMYYQTLDSVIADFAKFKIDVSKSRSAIWQGRKVLIFGVTNPIDTTSEQIWYDAINLYPVRIIYPHMGTEDIRYLNYMQIDGVFFPTERKLFGNGKLRYHTTYHKVRFNVDLNPAIFDPQQFGSYHWLRDDD